MIDNDSDDNDNGNNINDNDLDNHDVKMILSIMLKKCVYTKYDKKKSGAK